MYGISQTFDERAATQACAVMLAKAPEHRDEYMRILKLLYLADRRAMKVSGKTITGARLCAMKHGPVLSEVYNAMKPLPGFPYWAQHLSTSGYQLLLVGEPGTDDLSDFEVDTLLEVWDEFRDMGTWDLVNMLHDPEQFPEWVDPAPAKVRPISFEDMLRGSGVEDEAIEAIRESACQAAELAFARRS